MSNRRIHVESQHTQHDRIYPADFLNTDVVRLDTKTLAQLSKLLQEAAQTETNTSLEKALRLLDALPQSPTPGVRAFLRFCITEVLPLPNQNDQLKLLFWHLSSIQSEYARLPITSGGYAIDSIKPKPRLLDSRYTLKPDVLEVSSRKTGDVKLDLRYAKEAQQIERLQDWLHNTLPPSISSEKQQLAVLKKQGWVQITNFLNPEAAKKLQCSQVEPLLLGPKALYCMPSSEVHPGGMSVLVLVQPTYLLTEKRFVLLHDQQMVELTNIRQLKLFSQLGSSTAGIVLQQLVDGIQLTADTIESTIMTELTPLPNALQTATPNTVFTELLNTLAFSSRITQFLTTRSLNKSEQSVKELCNYLLTTLDTELLNTEASTDNLIFTEQIIRDVVLPALFDKTKLTEHRRQKLQAMHHELRHTSFDTFLTGISATIPAVFKQFNVSGLDCLVGLVNPFTKSIHAGQSLAALQTGALTRAQLAQTVGMERAKKWTMGICEKKLECMQKTLLHVNPLTHKTWVGECGFCLLCEEAMSNTTMPADLAPTPSSELVQKPTLAKSDAQFTDTPLPPSTFSSFVASLI